MRSPVYLLILLDLLLDLLVGLLAPFVLLGIGLGARVAEAPHHLVTYPTTDDGTRMFNKTTSAVKICNDDDDGVNMECGGLASV